MDENSSIVEENIEEFKNFFDMKIIKIFISFGILFLIALGIFIIVELFK